MFGDEEPLESNGFSVNTDPLVGVSFALRAQPAAEDLNEQEAYLAYIVSATSAYGMQDTSLQLELQVVFTLSLGRAF